MSAWVFHHSQLQSALDAYEAKQNAALAGIGVDSGGLHREIVMAFLLSDEAAELRIKESPTPQGRDSKGVL